MSIVQSTAQARVSIHCFCCEMSRFDFFLFFFWFIGESWEAMLEPDATICLMRSIASDCNLCNRWQKQQQKTNIRPMWPRHQHTIFVQAIRRLTWATCRRIASNIDIDDSLDRVELESPSSMPSDNMRLFYRSICPTFRPIIAIRLCSFDFQNDNQALCHRKVDI